MQYDLGVCDEHNRNLEAYCTQCHVLVCPTCVMFTTHKQHSVVEPNEAIKQLRDSLDKNVKSGKLKIEATEVVLVDIRQALVQCDQQRNKILKEVDKVMTELIETLKERKNLVITQVDEYFKQERERILVEETKWREKQRIAEDLLLMSSRKDSDQQILTRSKYVADGLDLLNEKIKFNDLPLIASIDAILHHTDDTGKPVDISSQELQQLFRQYLQINDYKRIQYKC